MAADSPLMEAGLNSISSTEFTSMLADSLKTELPQVMLFDHPTIVAMTSFIVAIKATV